jgi:hypothetical protein
MVVYRDSKWRNGIMAPSWTHTTVTRARLKLSSCVRSQIKNSICPGRTSPKRVFKRPSHPDKITIEKKFTVGKAEAA